MTSSPGAPATEPARCRSCGDVWPCEAEREFQANAGPMARMLMEDRAHLPATAPAASATTADDTRWCRCGDPAVNEHGECALCAGTGGDGPYIHDPATVSVRRTEIEAVVRTALRESLRLSYVLTHGDVTRVVDALAVNNMLHLGPVTPDDPKVLQAMIDEAKAGAVGGDLAKLLRGSVALARIESKCLALTPDEVTALLDRLAVREADLTQLRSMHDDAERRVDARDAEIRQLRGQLDRRTDLSAVYGYELGQNETGRDIEAWLKAQRDAWGMDTGCPEWAALDAALDDLRLHMQTGTPLMFATEQADRAAGPEVTFPSKTFGRDEWDDFLQNDPTCTERHPDQRLRVHADEAVVS